MQPLEKATKDVVITVNILSTRYLMMAMAVVMAMPMPYGIVPRTNATEQAMLLGLCLAIQNITGVTIRRVVVAVASMNARAKMAFFFTGNEVHTCRALCPFAAAPARQMMVRNVAMWPSESSIARNSPFFSQL